MVENLQIAQKLGLVLIIPLVALVALTTVQVGQDLGDRSEAARNTRHAQFAATVTGLTHQLQLERDLSLGFIAAPAVSRQAQLAEQRERTANAVRVFQEDLAGLDVGGGDPRLPDLVGNATELLGQLNTQRRLVDQTENPQPAGTRLFYSDTIRALLEAAAASDAGEQQLLNDNTLFSLMTQIKEAASLERGLVYAALAGNQLSVSARQRLTQLIGTQDSVTAQFLRAADTDVRRFYASVTVNQNGQVLAGLRRAMLTPLQPGQRVGGVGFGSGQGVQDALKILTTHVDNLRKVEARLGETAAATSLANQNAATGRALTNGGVLVAALALAVGCSLLIARSMVHQLRRLAGAAHQVAARQLPTVVDRLQRGELQLDEVTTEGTRLGARTRDEIGQVAKAFDDVHQVALRVAGEQAALRHSIGQLFLNLARRSQVLIDRQLDLIDELEQNEADPDELGDLFRLDHLATRMRRNAENLIVLSDTKPQRRWSEPVGLVDVVRAALAEVEDYQRIDVMIVDRIMVVGAAANDLAHLLAELLENATSFSSAASRVQVAGQVIGAGYLLEIEDRGIGMSDDQLIQANERLATPSAIDPALSRTLGFHVVGRLAARHNIATQLRHSWYGGITALVRLPATVLNEEDDQTAAALDRRVSRGPNRLVPLLNRDTSRSGDREAAELADSSLASYLPLRRHLSGTPDNRTIARPERQNGRHQLAGPPPANRPGVPRHQEPRAGGGPGTGEFPEGEVPGGEIGNGVNGANGGRGVDGVNGVNGQPDPDPRIRDRLSDYQHGLRRGREAAGDAPPDNPGAPPRP